MKKEITEWEVLTPTGWSDFSGIMTTEKNVIHTIATDTDTIKCSSEHKIKLSSGKFAEACNIKVDDVLFPKQKVIKTHKKNKNIKLFDLLDVKHKNEYYTNNLVSHNCAHVEGIEDLWLALYPTLSTGGSAILISTPAGVGNFFHRVWKKAKDGESDFVPIELMWTVHPERDQKWFDEQKKAILEAKGERGVAMELLCSFAASGDTFLNTDVMSSVFANIKEPIAYWGPDGVLKKDTWIWEHPKSEHKYIISADIARGDAADFSAFHIIDTNTDEVVAEFKGKVPPDVFGEMLATIGLKYNMAMICPERNSVGLTACLKLKDLHYPNLYYNKMHKNLYMVYSTIEMKDEIPGFETTQKSKTEILAKLEDVLRNQKLKTYSERLYSELQTFVYKKGNKVGAQKGYNDDLIMALAIGNSLYSAGGVTVYDSDEIAKSMLMGMSVSTKTFSTSDKDHNHEDNTLPIMTDGSLSEFLDKNRSMASHANAKTHNYNSPFWAQFSWMFKD